jgi:hypothetical protein
MGWEYCNQHICHKGDWLLCDKIHRSRKCPHERDWSTSSVSFIKWISVRWHCLVRKHNFTYSGELGTKVIKNEMLLIAGAKLVYLGNTGGAKWQIEKY